MSTFDYQQSKQLAVNLVEKFGTESKVITPAKTVRVKTVFMDSRKFGRPDGAQQSQVKRVYAAGTEVEINTNDRLDIKGVVYLITNVEVYNFDNKTKVLYILDIAK